MGHVDERDADLLLEPFQQALHLSAKLEVERPERFVEEQDLRLENERSGKRDTLLLAPRELTWLRAVAS